MRYVTYGMPEPLRPLTTASSCAESGTITVATLALTIWTAQVVAPVGV